MSNNTSVGVRVPTIIVTLFGLSELTALLFAQISTNFFAYYLTDVVFLSAAAMGTVLLVGRIGDIITLILSGVVEERFTLKWGKYRSWLLVATPIAVITLILQYTPMNGSDTFKGIYYAVFYILSYGFFNFGRTSQLALLNAFGSNQEDRLRLSAIKAQYASLARIIFSATFMPLVLIVAATSSEGRGFLIAAIAFAVVYIVPQLSLFKVSDKYDRPEDANEKSLKKSNLTSKEMIEQIIKNPPLMLIMVGETVKATMNTIVMMMASYYFKYVIVDMSMISIFMTAVAVTTFAGALAGKVFAKKLGKKNAYVVSLLGTSLILILARFVGGTNSVTFTVTMCVAFFIFAIIAVIGPAMFSDCIEYGKYKIGKEARAFIMSMYTLPIKIGVAIAGAVVGFGLSTIGYDATAEITPAISSGLFNMITLVPAIILGIGFIAMIFYSLTENRVNEIIEHNRKTQ